MLLFFTSYFCQKKDNSVWNPGVMRDKKILIYKKYNPDVVTITNNPH
jgi:hypothetical protein